VRPTGDGENLIRHSKNFIEYCEKGDVPLLLYFAWTDLSMGHYYLDEFETALKYVQKGLEIQKEMGFTYFMSFINFCVGLIHLDLGELENAEKCTEKAMKLAQENHEKNSEGMSWALLGRILGKKEPEEIERAEEHILKGIQILEELKAKPAIFQGYFYLGELYADAGKKDEAMNHLKKAEKMFQEMGMDYYLAKTKEVLGRVDEGG
jgi:tetratricopeptide (TPR) repeat protein